MSSSTLIAATGANDPSNNRALASRYASSVPWKSRCSWLRLVKHTAANDVPSTSRRARPCDVTSIATTPTPASRISARSCCRSGASGVVGVTCGVATGAPSTRAPTVPITPVRVAAGAPDGLEQERGGRLAVRAGDAEAAHGPRRVPEQRRRRGPERAAHQRHAGLRDLPTGAVRQDVDEAFDQQCHRARRDRVGGEGVAVDVGTGDARVEASGPDAAAVVGDRRDLDVAADQLEHLEPGQQVVQAHACGSSCARSGRAGPVPPGRACADGPAHEPRRAGGVQGTGDAEMPRARRPRRSIRCRRSARPSAGLTGPRARSAGCARR